MVQYCGDEGGLSEDCPAGFRSNDGFGHAHQGQQWLDGFGCDPSRSLTSRRIIVAKPNGAVRAWADSTFRMRLGLSQARILAAMFHAFRVPAFWGFFVAGMTVHILAQSTLPATRASTTSQ